MLNLWFMLVDRLQYSQWTLGATLNVYKNFMVVWQVCCSSPCHKLLRGYCVRLLWVENKSLNSYDAKLCKWTPFNSCICPEAVKKYRMGTNHCTFFWVHVPMHIDLCVMDVCVMWCVCIQKKNQNKVWNIFKNQIKWSPLDFISIVILVSLRYLWLFCHIH